MIGIIMLVTLVAAPAGGVRDPRDGQVYRTVRIGDRSWLAENLRYQSPRSRCYDNDLRRCAAWGRLYSHEEAVTACPPGWRLPSDADWMRLEEAVGVPAAELPGERERGRGSGDRLKPGGDTGFDALYAGYADPHENGAFRHGGRTAAFWASTLDGADDVSELAWHRDVDVRRTGIYRSRVNVTYALPVRCVAD